MRQKSCKIAIPLCCRKTLPENTLSAAGMLVLLLAAVFVSGCTFLSLRPEFDPQACMETIPRRVPGLEILSGPRTEKNIIRDMVPAVCNGRVLFRRMAAQNDALTPGTVVFRVLVEYTGEVYAADIHSSTIQSETFLQEVSDFIMDTDFIYWADINQAETVFLYPVTFGK
ncbi:MAG: hypothetical protein SWH61_03540 [Thermodesulfobacteriota bacterium]|nr:hypothetical protein [Thermodesulfobacteriota bacterium]